MRGRRLGGIARKLALVLVGLLALVVVVAVAVAVSNRSLPGPLTDTEHLEPLDKARLQEAIRLRSAYGDQAWPGWAKESIPVRLSNGLVDFLVDYRWPPSDWELVTDDDVAGRPYYRKLAVQDLSETGAAAAESDIDRLMVDGVPVAGLVTKRAMDTFLIQQLAHSVPRLARPFMPYRSMVQSTEVYVSSMVNSTLQSYFDGHWPERMSEARLAFENISGYPFGLPAQLSGWPVEIASLVEAVESPSEADSLAAARRFLATRDTRRQSGELDPWSIHLERQTEWSKGLAMYAELVVWRSASENASDTPVAELAGDPDFDGYGGYSDHWAQVVAVSQSCSRRPCPMRFQYTGMLQAFVLDRHLPGWQARVTGRDVFLEDLVRQAVSASGS
jgi:hypothetical protein